MICRLESVYPVSSQKQRNILHQISIDMTSPVAQAADLRLGIWGMLTLVAQPFQAVRRRSQLAPASRHSHVIARSASRLAGATKQSWHEYNRSFGIASPACSQ